MGEEKSVLSGGETLKLVDHSKYVYVTHSQSLARVTTTKSYIKKYFLKTQTFKYIKMEY